MSKYGDDLALLAENLVLLSKRYHRNEWNSVELQHKKKHKHKKTYFI